MFSERPQVRMILALLTTIAVASAWQIEASEPAPCRMRSMRRSNTLARRGLTENRVVATEISKEPKKDSGLEEGSKPQITGDVRAVARSTNQFAFDLYDHQHEQDGNKFLSPASIATALAMTYAGARGETKTQMAQVLHFDLPDPQLHAGFGALNSILNTRSKSYRLSMANRLWGQNGLSFQAPFLNSTLEHYGTELGAVDFARTEQARQTMNQWVGEKTGGKISELIPPGVLHEKICFVLTNAIYFKGTWQYRFSKTDTQDASFHLSSEVGQPTTTQDSLPGTG